MGHTSSSVGRFSLATIIGLTLSLVVILLVGLVFGCCGMWCLMKSQGYNRERELNTRRSMELPPIIYEEPVLVAPVQTAFSVTENQAYGKVKST